jgi:hypothetical protein
MTKSPGIQGLRPILSQKWVFKLYVICFSDFSACLGGFWPLLEDLEPFLRPDLGGSWDFVAKFKPI